MRRMHSYVVTRLLLTVLHGLLTVGCVQGTELSTPDITITIEHANTVDTRMWGLMQRKTLPPNHGMLFTYPHPQRLGFWMFNTFINLSVAFIDDTHIIKEIHHLQAHPEKMQSLPPIHNVAQLRRQRYSAVMAFFEQRTATSSKPYRYALEMEADWFKNHDVQIGDRVHWKPSASTAYVTRNPK